MDAGSELRLEGLVAGVGSRSGRWETVQVRLTPCQEASLTFLDASLTVLSASLTAGSWDYPKRLSVSSACFFDCSYASRALLMPVATWKAGGDCADGGHGARG